MNLLEIKQNTPQIHTIEEDDYIISYFFDKTEELSFRNGRDYYTTIHVPILYSVKVYIPFLDKFVEIGNDKALDQKAQQILDESNLEY